jgi:para-nitrobenzyl esterase
MTAKPKGNYGFADQIAALDWVQTTSGPFGGDAARITTFGQSAGGSKTGVLV